MSRHEVVLGNREWVFGWDQMLMSFFLQVHDSNIPNPDENPIVWLGTAGSTMYEVDDLVREARKYGLYIDYNTQVALFGEKDNGN